MQQRSIGVWLCCRFAPVLLSQGFAVCIAPNSKKSTNVAEKKILALTYEKEMTLKKHIIPHADDPCRIDVVLKTPCQSPCQKNFSKYQFKEDMKGLKEVFGWNNQSDLFMSADSHKLLPRLMTKIELTEKDSGRQEEAANLIPADPYWSY